MTTINNTLAIRPFVFLIQNEKDTIFHLQNSIS